MPLLGEGGYFRAAQKWYEQDETCACGSGNPHISRYLRGLRRSIKRPRQRGILDGCRLEDREILPLADSLPDQDSGDIFPATENEGEDANTERNPRSKL